MVCSPASFVLLFALPETQPYAYKLEFDYVETHVFIWTGVGRRSVDNKSSDSTWRQSEQTIFLAVWGD